MAKSKTGERTVRASGVHGFTANESDGIVLLSIKTDKQSEKHFAINPDAIPILVSRLIAAGSVAARKADRLPPAINAVGTTIAYDPPTKMVTLSMMPTLDLHVAFGMDLSLTRKTIASLSEVVAKLEPDKSDKFH